MPYNIKDSDMTDIEQILRMSLEIEGILKVLRDRDSIEARDLLCEKIDRYTAAIKTYLQGSSAGSDTAAEEVETKGEDLLHEANAVEVKDQEAQETEVEPEADAAEEAVREELEKDSTAHVEPVSTGEPNAKLLKAFTLNDRFRFRRELFGGDDADFTETLKLLVDMDSYADACDYLYNDMMWDSSDPNVADFMAIVAANMPQ